MMSERLSRAIAIGIAMGMLGEALGTAVCSVVGHPGLMPPLLFAAAVGAMSGAIANWSR